MKEIVFERNSTIYTTSEILAEGFEIAHRSIKETILKYTAELKSMGPVFGFKIQEPKNGLGGQPEKNYILNRKQAMLLGALSKNTEVVVKFKVELINKFDEMEQQLQQRFLGANMRIAISTLEDLKILEKMQKDMLKIYSGTGQEEDCKDENAIYTSKVFKSIIGQTELNLENIKRLQKLQKGSDGDTKQKYLNDAEYEEREEL